MTKEDRDVVARVIEVGGKDFIVGRPCSEGWEIPTEKAFVSSFVRDHTGPRMMAVPGVKYDATFQAEPIEHPPSVPGKHLIAYWLDLLSPAEMEIFDRAPFIMSLAEIYGASSAIFEGVAADHLILAGKEVPVRPGAAWVQLDATDAGAFTLGVIADTATPRAAGTGPRFAGMRVFTADEWAMVSGPPLEPDAGVKPAPSPVPAAPTAATSGPEADTRPPYKPTVAWGAMIGEREQWIKEGRRVPMMTEKQIRKWAEGLWSGPISDGQIRKLMGVWPGRRRGAVRGMARRNAPK